MQTDHGHVTKLLQEWEAGDPSALRQLMPLVYDDLKRIAHRQLRGERPGHTLDTTALVHECYLNLVDQKGATPERRRSFFGLAATAMRHILVDYARRRATDKRGGGRVRVTLDGSIPGSTEATDELLALDEALIRLSRRDPRLVRLVECRYFGGLTVEETAEVLGVSARTAARDWTRARAYLYRALTSDAGVESRAPS